MIECDLTNKVPHLKQGVLLSRYTTFKIGGKADYFLLAKTGEDVSMAITWAKENQLPYFILGGGSNLLISDEGLRGLTIKICASNIEAKEDGISAEAGAHLSQVVDLAKNKGFSGFEWAVGIPGSIGGAICGNAGAFSGEMADVVKEVTVLDSKAGKIRFFSKSDCNFSYRNSIFKGNPDLVVLSAEFRLENGEMEKIKSLMNQYMSYRRERHPKEPSAGSIFKNVKTEELPEDFFSKFPEAKKSLKENNLPAAYLIDKCGLKGRRAGGAMVSEKHPNFLINFKDARAKDVLSLIDLVKSEVKEKFGVSLEEELRILGP